jgi:vitamin B12 transporter
VYAADVLDTVPGLSVFDNGAFGGVTSVRIRGASSDKTMVLVDGVPVNDPSQPSGGYDLAGFDLADVKRIEILSGPQASLWGSDAIGGVIAFTTREPTGLSASIEAGSYGSAHGALSAGVAEDRYALGLSLSGLRTDGISKAADGRERDGEETWTGGLTGRARPFEGVELDARVRYQKNRAEIDDFDFFTGLPIDGPDVAKSETWSGVARATVQGPWAIEHRFSVAASGIDRASFAGAFPYRYTGEQRVWRWTAERGRPEDRFGFTGGIERNDVEADLSDGGRRGLGTTSAFGVVRVTPLARLSTTFSLRRDDPDGLDGVTTGRAAATLDLGGGFALLGSWGQGFKVPTISQTACDFCFPAGPADLRPERAEGWDLGLRRRSADGRYTVSVTGYRLAIRDQIAYVFDPVTFEARYRNLDRTLSKGLEAEASAVLGGGFSLSGEYAWTDAVDLSTGARLPRVPEHQGSATLLWRGEPGHAALTVRAEGEQADVGGVRGGFVTADFAGALRLNARTEATLRLVNLTDARWQQALGYGEPGRSAWVGLRLRY